GEHQCEVEEDLAGVMAGQRPPPWCQSPYELLVQTGGAHRLGQQHPARFAHRGHLGDINLHARIQPGSLHPEGAPSTSANWTLDKPHSPRSGAPFYVLIHPSDTSPMKARG